MIYHFDLDQMILDLIPRKKRFMTLYSLLKAFNAPIKSLYLSFQEFRSQQLYEAHMSGQVMQLERLLNDKFDPNLRRVHIVHGIEPHLISHSSLDRLTGEAGLIYQQGFIKEYLPLDFRVILPAALQEMQGQMKVNVKTYALASKKFDFKVIN